MKVPVLYLIFKRREQTLQSFAPIKAYKPSKLYIAADGPRENVQGEEEECEATRKGVLDLIDWDCEVKTLFRNKNVGCSEAVYGGISWFFEHEEFGIINEDDVVLSPDFFHFCEKLLPLYKDEKQVMLISSRNHSGLYEESDEYVFSYFVNIWGWATWRRAWQLNTNTFKGWENYPKHNLIKRFGLFQGLVTIWYYYKCSNPRIQFESWDYTWSYNILVNDGISLCPKVNLSSNIGTTIDGANAKEGNKDPYVNLRIGKVKWPIKYTNKVKIDEELDKADRADFFRLRMLGLKKYIGL